MGRTNLNNIKQTEFVPNAKDELITYGDLKLAKRNNTIWIYSMLTERWNILYRDHGCTDISSRWKSFRALK